MAEEDTDPTGAPPLPTGIPVQEPPAFNALQQAHAKGITPARVGEVVSQGSTTPNVAVQAKPARPIPRTNQVLMQRTPVTNQAITQSPAVAGLATNQEVHQQLSTIELALSDKEEAEYKRQAQETEDEKLNQGSTWDAMQAGQHQRNLARAGLARMFGAGTDESIKYWEDKLAKYEKENPDPGVLKKTVTAAVPLAWQVGPGVAIGAGVIGLLGAPETGGTSVAGALGLTGLIAKHYASADMALDAAGSSYIRFRKIQGPNGPIDDNVAKAMAMGVGLVNGAFAEFALPGLGKAITKMGGKAVAGEVVEQAMTKALSNPTVYRRLYEIGKIGLHSGSVMSLFSVMNELVSGEAEAGATRALGGEAKSQGQILMDAWRSGVDSFGPGFILGAAPASAFSAYGALAQGRARGNHFVGSGLQAEMELAQGEAKPAASVLENPLAEMGLRHDPEGQLSLRSVPPEELRAMQSKDGAVFPEKIERAIAQAEQAGTKVEIPAPEFTTQVLTQPGGERLEPNIAVGDGLSIKEQEELAPVIEKFKDFKDPIEEDTERVRKDIETKLTAGGRTPEYAATQALLLSRANKTTALLRARSLGEDPKVFEHYQENYLEVAGARENQRLAFNKSLESISQKARRDKRREGSPYTKEAPAEEAEAKAASDTPLARIQKAAAKNLGQVFTAFKLEGEAGKVEGRVFLTAEDAFKAAGEGKSYRVQALTLKPEDITGAGPNELTIRDVGGERILPIPAPRILDYFGKDAKLKGETNAEQVAGGEVRGWMQKLPGLFQLALTGKADETTFFHEMGHYIHFVLEKSMPGLLEPFHRYLGLKPGEQMTPHQMEKFAQGLELYFLRGEAPTRELIGAYADITHWMKGVHDVFPQLPDNVQRSMHRLFALDEEVELAAQTLGLDSRILEEGAFTKEQLMALREKQDAIRAKAKERPHTATRQFYSKQSREEFRNYEVSAAHEVVTDPANNVYAWLRTGSRLDGEPMGFDHMPLNRDDVKMLGFNPDSDVLKSLVTTRAETEAGHGYDPAFLAARLGFADGETMLKRLEKVEPNFKLQRDRLANWRFAQEHPGWIAADDWVKAEGEKAVVGKQYDDYHRQLMKTIGQQLGHKEDAKGRIDFLKAIARNILRDKTVQQLRPSWAWSALARNTKLLYDAIGKSNWEDALNYGDQVTLAKELFQGLTEMKEDVTDRAKEMKKFAQDESLRARMAKDHPEYLKLMDWFLQGMRFKEESVTPEEAKAAQEMIAERGEVFPWRNQWNQGEFWDDYRRMNAQEALSAMDAVKTLEHLAKQHTMVVLEGKEQSRLEARDGLSNSIDRAASRRTFGGNMVPWMPKEGAKLWDNIANPQTRFETLTWMFDRASHTGLWSKLKDTMFGDVRKVGQTGGGELARNAELSEAQRHVLKVYDDARKSSGKNPEKWAQSLGTKMPESLAVGGKRLTVAQFIEVLGNMRNEGNLDRLLKAHNWDFKQLDAGIKQAIQEKTLLPAHFDIVNGRGRLYETFWPRLRDVRARQKGLEPEKVTGLTLDYGEGMKVEGGYWPIFYDRKASGLAPIAEDDLLHPDFHRDGMAEGMVKNRAASGLPLKLDLDPSVVFRHLSRVLTYIHLQEPYSSFNKLTKDPVLRAKVEEHFPGAMTQVDNFGSAVARSGSGLNVPGMEAWQGVMGSLRQNMNLMYLGGKLVTPMHQLTGIVTAMNNTSVMHVLGALKDVISSPVEQLMGRQSSWQRALKESGELHSAVGLAEDITGRNILAGKFDSFQKDSKLGRKLAPLKETFINGAMFLVKFTQQISATTAYLAGESFREEQLSKQMQEAGDAWTGPRPGSVEWQDDVRHFANSNARDAHGAYGVKDMPEILRSKSHTIFGYFATVYGYANQVFNLMRRQGYLLKAGEYQDFMKLFITGVTVPALVSAFFHGAFKKKDDSKDYLDPANLKWSSMNAAWAIWQQATHGFLLGGDATNFFLAKGLKSMKATKDIQAFAGHPGNLEGLWQTMERSATHGFKGAEQFMDGNPKWKENAHKFAYDSLDMATMLNPTSLKVPFHGLGNGAKYLERLNAGELKFSDGTWFTGLTDNTMPGGKAH